MIKKLDSNGARDKTRDWIQAFLADRTLQVVVKGKFQTLLKCNLVSLKGLYFPKLA